MRWLVVAAAVLVAGCLGEDTGDREGPAGDDRDDGSSGGQGGTGQEGDGGQETHEVDIRDFAFQPASLEVSVGDTVTWTNRDQADHTATAEDGTFDSEPLGQGESYEFTFDAAGSHAYICTFHPTMEATVTVS